MGEPNHRPDEMLPSLREFLGLSKSETQVAFLVLCLSVIARGYTIFSPAYSIDDYYTLTQLPTIADVGSGRLGYIVLEIVFRYLGVSSPAAGLVGSVAMTLALIWTGILLCRLWRVDRNPVISGIVVTLFCLHPYQTEYFVWRGVTIFVALALVMCFTAITSFQNSFRLQLAAVPLLTFGFLITQVVVNHIVMALLFSCVLAIARGDFALPGSAADGTHFGKRLRSQMLTLLGAIGLYFAVIFTYSVLSGIPVGHRGGFIQFAELGPRLQQIGTKLLQMFLYDEPLIPLATKLMLSAAPLLTMLLILRPWGPRDHEVWLSAGRNLVAFVLAILIGAPLSLGVMLVMSSWWPVPRVTAHVAILWAGLFALSYLGSSGNMRRIIIGSSVLIAFSFMGISNHISTDQIRVNMRDQKRVNRILARVESISSLDSLQGLVVVGGSVYYGIPMRTTMGDMNVSALYQPWSKVGAFSEISGQRFQLPPEKIVAKAEAQCEKSGTWPGAGSVFLMDGYGVVCLTK